MRILAGQRRIRLFVASQLSFNLTVDIHTPKSFCCLKAQRKHDIKALSILFNNIVY